MKTARNVACLIPFYNEGERLFDVLNVVTQVCSITQIICIDDGSDENCCPEIEARWPHIEVIRLTENHGKAGAIKAGLSAVREELVLLMDADLQDISPAELEQAIQAIRNHDEVDMVILRRVHADWFVKFNRGDILLSGERIIRKRDLDAIFQQTVEGFQLEVAINEYMQQHRKVVRWFPWSATNTYKMDKRGPVEGFLKDAQMYADIVTYVGPVAYARQMVTFARKPLRS
ncbi:glycosyl transferase family protein [Fibrisoma limi BUZ 3]|uniref:Glycosyl transferase family protein n=1 Tax=Fibrisoma limi BUZ 3 TaxID=1185876 RepID=I2GLM7_9BACT|nr:glycosyltransferase family 2 protein [Fibrisoma limi]CCH54803.1 glycosyl transferase family protein [Fibrisoma limi BUZ 3]